MPIEKLAGGGIICTGEGVNVFQLLAIKGALKLERAGMKHSRGSVRAKAKQLTGLKTNDYDRLIAGIDELVAMAADKDGEDTEP